MVGISVKKAENPFGKFFADLESAATAQNARGDRNNNPGNLEDGEWARSQPGYVGSDGRFARFKSYKDGARAQEQLLANSKGYKGKSVAGIIQRYAPVGDNSEDSIRNYIGYVAARAGLDPDKPVPKGSHGKIAEAMREFENGRTQKLNFSRYGGTIGRSNVAGGYNASRAGVGVADPTKFLEGLESSLGPEAKSSQNVQQNSETIFGSDGELTRRADVAEAELVRQGEQIDVLNQVSQAAQLAQREALTEQIQQTRAISDTIVTGTQELKDKVLPVFQARGRVADQLDKLATLNPIERGIRSIFDLNYDRNYLKGQLAEFDQTLQTRAADYDYLNKLHNAALTEIDRRYKLDTAMPSLLEEQAKEDLAISGMRLQQTVGMLGSLKDRISTESQLISAKASAREDLLVRLDIPTVTELMTKAQESGGMVSYNGVEFSYKELRDRVQVSEQQELQTEGYRMSIAANRMNMADKYADNLARSLTRGQLESAIANGGVFNGVQLAQDTLTQLYQGAVSRDETRALAVAREMPAKLALQTGSDYLNQAVGLYRRGSGMFGAAAMTGSKPYLTQGTELVRKLITATEQGAPPEVISVLSQQIAANTTEYHKFVQQKILDSVGGDKRAAGYMQGFMFGTPMSEGTAAEAMTYFALKGGLPDGVSISPEAKQVFKKAQKIIEEHKDDRVGRGKISMTDLQRLVVGELTESSSQILGQARHDRLYADLPGVAQKTGHAFGKFSRERWSEIRSEAAMSAAESIASEVDTTPQNVLQMLRTGKPVNNNEDGKTLLEQTVAQAGKYNSVEMHTLVTLIDNEKQIQPGRRNSSVMLDFMGSPQFTTGISTYSESLGSNSFAEYLINPLTRGATERNFINTRQLGLDSQSAVHQAARQMAQNPASSELFRPISRSRMILESIPGVNKQGAQTLAPFVKQFYETYSEDHFTNGVESPNARFRREDAALFAALQQTKFQNPQMETYRKVALKGWQEHATAQQGFIERVLDGLFGDNPSPYTMEVSP